MERKIGEIFENKGEWYQCVEWIGPCCEHYDLKFNECNGKCDCDEREDGKNIIFKKLEKVGEPDYLLLDGKKVVFQGFMLVKAPPVIPNGFNRKFLWGSPMNAYHIFIEIEKHDGWVNLYRDGGLVKTGWKIFPTKEEAVENFKDKEKYITPTKIEWYE